MAKGIILVESRPSSPERDQDYNTWYDEVHLRELVALDGFVSARRLRPVDGNGPYVAIYEIEGDDLQAILDGMIANAGQLHMSDALQSWIRRRSPDCSRPPSSVEAGPPDRLSLGEKGTG